MTLFFFLTGLAALIAGAELLVRGASKIAAGFGISPLIIGLTVVAFGTSAPELAVSIKSAASGQGAIALGNVVGSNIFNVLFILGLSALIIPLRVSRDLIRFDVPVMIVLSLLVLVLAWNGLISRTDGGVLCAGLLAFTLFLFFRNRNNTSEPASGELEVPPIPVSPPSEPKIWIYHSFWVVAGLFLLITGSRWFVDGAVTFAHQMGVSEVIIGLTIVAAGTSLPEVVTSVIAAVRGERDMAVGNIIGSNLFNIMGVLGLAALFAPTGIDVSESMIAFDIPLMIAVALACLPVFFTHGTIHRWEGVLFFGYYTAYTLYLILSATEHSSLPVFSNVMAFFVIPLTLITVLVITVQQLRN